MDWAPGLNRPRSCPPAVLDVGSWCSGSRRRSSHRRYSDIDCDSDYYEDGEELEASDYYTGRRSSEPIWRVLWRRIVKEKNRLFRSRSRVRIGYDPYTYAQNFDQGSTWLEPENLTRSFSARFADPSKTMIILQRVRKLD